jgi:hypothetical protein
VGESGELLLEEGTEFPTVCAAVKAESADIAKAIIFASYDNPPWRLEWRFVEERPDDWSPFNTRFPRGDWMRW